MSEQRIDVRGLLARVRDLEVEGVLRRAGVEVNRYGRGWPCPACGADGRSCGIERTNLRRWKCFACDRGGTAVDLWLLREGCDPDRIDDRAVEKLLELVDRDELEPWAAPEREVDPPGMTAEAIGAWWMMSARPRWKSYEGWQKTRDWLVDARGIFGRDWRGQVGSVMFAGVVPGGRTDIRVAVAAGVCAVFPLRSTHPERLGQVRNVMIRPLEPTVIDPAELERWRVPKRYPKPWKMKPLNWGDGTMADGAYPLVYGDPARVLDAEVVVVVEGALDQLTGQALAAFTPGVGVIGARCAGDLRQLFAGFLKACRARRFVRVPHLDRMTERWPKGEGVEAMAEMGRQLRAARPEAAVCWWPWRWVLEQAGTTVEAFREEGRTDLNDLVRRDAGPPVVGWEQLRRIWLAIMEGAKR